jgi:hypothetical protein
MGIVTPDIHFIGGCVNPRAVFDAVVKRKFPSLAGSGSPLVQPVAWLLY